ncbi:MAG: arginine--tRNA ligase [Phycisphaerales bacterium JB065]
MTADPTAILNSRFDAAMLAAFGDDLPKGASALLSPSKNPKFGDFQANGAMGLAKRLGKPPREVAQAILEHLDIADIALAPEIAGPGFINITLKPDALAAAVAEMDSPQLGIEPAGDPESDSQKQTIVVDLCGVNLAKQMHVGHLRATVIGDALARLNERLGHEVIRQNHFGDWGLPIAMVTTAIKDGIDAGTINPDDLTLSDLEYYYRGAQADCAPDKRGLAAVEKFGLGPKARAELEEQVAGAEESLARAKAGLIALQSGDPAFVRVWERISQITLEACFANCAKLQANVTNEATAGESTYRDELADVVDDLVKRGVAEESNGALIVRIEDTTGIKEPCLIRKSDGGFLYATTDMAAIRRRVQKLGADRVIYAVDARQGLHFKQVFAAAKKAGYAKRVRGEGDAELFHAAFGTVLGEDNRPFKTRSGENVKLSDLLDEAIARADKAVAEKNPSLSDAERREVAEAVGIGAIKYADLSSDRIKDYVFSFDRMLAFEGNTGPYLQYAQVRVRSIFRKAEKELGISEQDVARAALIIGQPEEKALALELLKYADTVRGAAESCEPHRLCGYLFDLATAFSSFFTACPVLKAETEELRDSRLRLASLTGRVLRDGLHCLGIAAPERM